MAASNSSTRWPRHIHSTARPSLQSQTIISSMMKIAGPFLLSALLSFSHDVSGFTIMAQSRHHQQMLVFSSSARSRLSMSFTESKPRMTAVELEETFYKAVEMASSTSTVVDLDECDRLATELEQFENDSLGCEFEKASFNPLLCEKEVQDRLDVAGILRLKIELSLRYVCGSETLDRIEE
jgi:hypothetical protein